MLLPFTRIPGKRVALSGSGRSIADIAETVGYRSIANFNRQFKAAKGMTPRELRNRFRSAG